MYFNQFRNQRRNRSRPSYPGRATCPATTIKLAGIGQVLHHLFWLPKNATAWHRRAAIDHARKLIDEDQRRKEVAALLNVDRTTLYGCLPDEGRHCGSKDSTCLIYCGASFSKSMFPSNLHSRELLSPVINR